MSVNYGLRPSELIQEARRRIELVDATPFNQAPAGEVADTWRHVPELVSRTASPGWTAQHLGYAVYIPSISPRTRERGLPGDVRLQVWYTYKIRGFASAEGPSADDDLVPDAAVELMSAIVGEDHSWPHVGSVIPSTIYQEFGDDPNGVRLSMLEVVVRTAFNTKL